ncbi:tRNA(fMet)-specific endonuclease VapC [Cricetibacter osteomyelitidis]|uniref:Ribonuclease VapC n=1 Tax=Cricetibacter osteomyelitidis TaxID=1521931 RepID=A0A4R2T214_9PAST|nr:tRNA(fMet)-specific endonuclease VapC [Cricetibacter osteomyelitidis]TCP96949.1 tRNA(fMet)-specific endonuclease VapC [Cricetibacter osteomyelitidis]
MKYMLDTNICIYAIKRKPISVVEQLIKHQDQVCISSVTLMELYYGAEKSSAPERNRYDIDYFVANLVVLDYDPLAAAHTAEIRADLAAKGTPVGSYDSMIAGHARSLGLVCVTNNTKEFERIAGLRLENWWQLN